MNLFRIDPAERIDPLWRRLNGESGAVPVARTRAARLGRVVTITRINQHGQTRVCRHVSPSGRVIGR